MRCAVGRGEDIRDGGTGGGRDEKLRVVIWVEELLSGLEAGLGLPHEQKNSFAAFPFAKRA